MSMIDDLKAINLYMIRTKATNAKAESEKKAFAAWYRTLNLNITTTAMLAEAKRRRDSFNRANKPVITSISNTVNAVKAAAATVTAKPPAKPTPIVTGPKPTLREGSTGDYVKLWQRHIGVKDDGKFGSGTKSTTIAWQKSRGLSADGVVGPATWSRYDLEVSGKAVQAALTGGAAKPVSGGITIQQAQAASDAVASGAYTLPTRTGVVPVVTPGVKPTIREGSTGAAVKEWQRVIGVKDDGIFGPATKATTIAWQKTRGLTADGIVGPNTWSRAQAESAAAVVMPASNPMAAATQAAQAVAAMASEPVPHPSLVAEYAAAATAAPTGAVPYVQTQYAAPPQQQSSPILSAVTPPGILDAINTAPTWAKVTGAIAGVGALFGIGRLLRKAS